MFSDKNFDKVEFLYLLTINYNATKTIWKFPFNQFLVPLLGLIIHGNLNATLLIIRIQYSNELKQYCSFTINAFIDLNPSRPAAKVSKSSVKKGWMPSVGEQLAWRKCLCFYRFFKKQIFCRGCHHVLGRWIDCLPGKLKSWKLMPLMTMHHYNAINNCLPRMTFSKNKSNAMV